MVVDHPLQQLPALIAQFLIDSGWSELEQVARLEHGLDWFSMRKLAAALEASRSGEVDAGDHFGFEAMIQTMLS